MRGAVKMLDRRPVKGTSHTLTFDTLNLFIYINLNPKGKMRLVASDFSALQNVGPVSA